ncbi:hypothetical protein B0H13DRAFT_2328201 [Mycena leptocephala]|nr:hypothetical protein B0H13DRAFT_2328201 [Mycena leptocephala]
MVHSATTKKRCPLCDKRCKNSTALLQHMNQPNGQCNPSLHPSIVRAAKQYRRRKVLEEDNGPRRDDDAMDVDDYGEVPFLQSQNDDAPMEDATVPDKGPVKDYYPGAAGTYGRGDTFMDGFHKDEYASERKTNLYYPFASAEEWELAVFITKCNMTIADTNEFLKLRLTARMNLSFKTANDLRSRIESLPKGPVWKATPWKSNYPTKRPLTLYYRDPLECLQSLLGNPLVQDFIQYTPFRLWKSAEKLMRVYTEWLSGDDSLPEGATLLGTILSSDKTQLSTMTGNRQAHPLLISLADIDMDFRMKASHHAFLLLALCPIPKFIEKDPEIRGVLESRIFHAVLDFVLRPLKTAARVGVMMNDPLGWRRFCFTPLAAHIVDTPESAMIAGVAGKTSSVTTASYKNFGDAYRHPSRTRDHTIKQLRRLEKTTHPWNLRPYIKKAKQLRLNGVHRPFWQDWPLAEPSEFLTPEILHHWLKMFYDHVVKWCIAALGAAEIDFRFSVLWPHTGMRHFKEGISKSKQATGREHRDIMRYILPVIADATGVSKGFLKSIAALNTFFYHGQAPAIDEDVLDKMASALACFHAEKHAILKAGVRKGKKGPINNWHIPKLEFLQSVIPAIRANGVPLQWTADVTEHAHITEVKEPASNSNNQGYEAQICRNLDHRDKCHYFGLATAMDSSGVDLGVCVEGNDTDANPVLDDNTPLLLNRSSDILEKIGPIAHLSSVRTQVDYFAESVSLLEGNHPNAPTPFRTFTSADTSTGFHLNRDHVGHRLSIEDAATKFDLPDLRDAILSFIQRPHDSLVIGGRRPNVEDDYRLSYLQVWHNFRIQTRSYHDPKRILVAETVNAEPPSKSWQFGRGDPVIVNADADFHWPKSGLAGHAVCQLKMIFHVVTGKGFVPPAGTDQFLAGLFRDPATTMYHMKRARRTNGSPMGDVVPLERLRAIVDLTILNYCDDFHLNHFYTKELFWALTQ